MTFQENANSYKKEVVVTQVSAGYQHSVFLDKLGRVYTSGNNDCGQLGLATRSTNLIPMQIDAFDLPALQVAAGDRHTLVLTRDGGLIYSFGSNHTKQLGVRMEGVTSLRPILVQEIAHIPMSRIAAGSFSGSISDDGQVYIWGTGTFGKFATPHRMKKIKQKALQLQIGQDFGVVLTAQTRQLYTWGQNDFG